MVERHVDGISPGDCAQVLLNLEYEGRRRRASSLTRLLVSSVKAHRAPLILEVSFLFKGPY